MGKKILLADDSITIQKVIELTFSDEDFDVVTVGNGRLALERLPEVRPDIVLCDIIMPEKDGYEVCEQIKGNPALAHVPVLLLTGAFEPFDQERAARAGYDGSLAKPFEPETLIAKVKDLLARVPARPSAPSPAPRTPAEGPAPVLTFGRPPTVAPPPPPLPPQASAAPSFIPEEPFGGLHEPSFREPPPATEEAFAPMTEEESATLSAPPAPPSADAASTVMFRVGDLPWNAPVAAPPVAPAEPEPVFVPEPAEATEAGEESSVFEEVLEEDLDFGVPAYEPETSPPSASASGTVLFRPSAATLPPVPPGDDGTATGAFVPVPDEPVATPAPVPDFESEPIPELEPELEPEPEPEVTLRPATAPDARPAPARPPEPPPVFEPEPPPLFAATPTPVFKAAPAPPPPAEPRSVFEPDVTAVPEPMPAAPPPAPAAPESFADVAAAVAEPVPPPPTSETASLSVPVEMVEKIAQRVVAQISEKAVREIAWEVIPDLAEALLKQEIERLKAELQKT